MSIPSILYAHISTCFNFRDFSVEPSVSSSNKEFDGVYDENNTNVIKQNLTHTPSPPVALEMELEDADDESFSDESSEPSQKAVSVDIEQENKIKTEESEAQDLSVSGSFESVSEDIQEEFEDDFEDEDSGEGIKYKDNEDKDRSTNNISGLSNPSFSFTNDVSASQESEKSNESETMISRQTSSASDYEIR